MKFTSSNLRTAESIPRILRLFSVASDFDLEMVSVMIIVALFVDQARIPCRGKRRSEIGAMLLSSFSLYGESSTNNYTVNSVDEARNNNEAAHE